MCENVKMNSIVIYTDLFNYQKPGKKKKVKRKVAKEVERKPVVLPHLQRKYKQPKKDKVKREYRQIWNEKGKLSKKDTEYLG